MGLRKEEGPKFDDRALQATVQRFATTERGTSEPMTEPMTEPMSARLALRSTIELSARLSAKLGAHLPRRALIHVDSFTLARRI
jgi:hypothetical protein